ncbi:hypothetical protein C7212DRAFT_219906, partial [Tuber magnatum]
FNLYMNNYFSSIASFERLRDLGIGGCGIVRQNQSTIYFLTTILSLEDRIRVLCKKPYQSSSNVLTIHQIFGTMEWTNIPIAVITNDYNQYKVGISVINQYHS